jgi:hypothetical protein
MKMGGALLATPCPSLSRHWPTRAARVAQVRQACTSVEVILALVTQGRDDHLALTDDLEQRDVA